MPPVAGPSGGSFVDGLSSLLTSLAPLKVLPDADQEVIANLEALIVSAVQSGQAAQMQGQMDALGGGSMGGAGGAMSMPSAPATPAMPGMGGPMAGAMGAGAPGPGRGFSPQPAPPNAGEIRRLLSGPS